MSRNGTLLDPQAGMRDIHYSFGMSCKLTGRQAVRQLGRLEGRQAGKHTYRHVGWQGKTIKSKQNWLTGMLICLSGLTLKITIVQIFYLLGEVPPSESLFAVLPSSEFDTSLAPLGSSSAVSYTPVFLDEIMERGLRNETAEICGENLQCIFDYEVRRGGRF